jgi:hypothetical protein
MELGKSACRSVIGEAGDVRRWRGDGGRAAAAGWRREDGAASTKQFFECRHCAQCREREGKKTAITKIFSSSVIHVPTNIAVCAM